MAGEGLIALPGFWATYFEWMCESGDEQAVPLAERFGEAGADVDAAIEALMNEKAWPVFRVPFDDGHAAVVVYANLPEDGGIEYFATHPERDRQGSLATVDGHPAGPGLAWRELLHIAERQQRDLRRNPGVRWALQSPVRDKAGTRNHA